MARLRRKRMQEKGRELHANIELANQYMTFPDKKDLWSGYLKAVANTHTKRGLEMAPTVYCGLKAKFPTPQKAKNFCLGEGKEVGAAVKCGRGKKPKDVARCRVITGDVKRLFPMDGNGKTILDHVHHPLNPLLSVCAGGDMWNSISSAIKKCDRNALRSLLLVKDRKTFGENASTGWGLKAIDMLLLDEGCPQIVGDRHMLRMVNPNIEGDDDAKPIQQSEKKYDDHIRRLEKLARKQGATPQDYGMWHVATWLNRAGEGKDRDKAIGYIEDFELC